jgi:hypothetical protein
MCDFEAYGYVEIDAGIHSLTPGIKWAKPIWVTHLDLLKRLIIQLAAAVEQDRGAPPSQIIGHCQIAMMWMCFTGFNLDFQYFDRPDSWFAAHFRETMQATSFLERDQLASMFQREFFYAPVIHDKILHILYGPWESEKRGKSCL